MYRVRFLEHSDWILPDIFNSVEEAQHFVEHDNDFDGMSYIIERGTWAPYTVVER